MPQDAFSDPVVSDPVSRDTAPAGDGFEVDPAALRGVAGILDTEADALAEVTSAAEGHLASLHGCWGDDEVGRRFAARYEPAAATVTGNLQALAAGLARFATALNAVAEAYERTDRQVVALEAQLASGAVEVTR